FAAGIYVPLQVLPGAIRQIVGLTPFGAATQALDQAANGSWPSWVLLAVLLLWTVIFMAIAARWFRWESTTCPPRHCEPTPPGHGSSVGAPTPCSTGVPWSPSPARTSSWGRARWARRPS